MYSLCLTLTQVLIGWIISLFNDSLIGQGVACTVSSFLACVLAIQLIDKRIGLGKTHEPSVLSDVLSLLSIELFVSHT